MITTTYKPTRHGASIRDRFYEIGAAARLAQHGNLTAAVRALGTALSPRGPRYLQADGTRTWGSQGRSVSTKMQAKIDRKMNSN